MLELLEILVAIGEIWYLRRILAFLLACGFGYYAYSLFTGLPGSGDGTSDLLLALAYSIVAVFLFYLTFRRRKERS